MKNIYRSMIFILLISLLAAAGTNAYAAQASISNDLAAQVIAYTNSDRARYGLAPLRADAELTAAARVRAQELLQKFSHTRPDGSSWSTVSAKAKGENIARGYRSAAAVTAAWLSSAGHRRNILRESYGSIGVCTVRVNGVIYWVQLFGR